MNTINWNKQDYIVVAETLKSNDAMLHKGIFFIKTSKEAVDPLLQYLYPINEVSEGANSTALVRSILASSHAQFPSPIIEFILNHTQESQALIAVVVLNNSMLLEQHRKYLNFIITHEVGHILLGHLDPNNQHAPGSEGYVDNEIAADGFAVTVMGTPEPAIDLLMLFSDYGKRRLGTDIDQNLRDIIETGLKVIHRRLGTIL